MLHVATKQEPPLQGAPLFQLSKLSEVPFSFKQRVSKLQEVIGKKSQHLSKLQEVYKSKDVQSICRALRCSKSHLISASKSHQLQDFWLSARCRGGCIAVEPRIISLLVKKDLIP